MHESRGLGDVYKRQMQIKVSRQELSRLVGCSREMAGRVLKVLEEQGLVSASGKTIVVYGARPNRNL